MDSVAWESKRERISHPCIASSVIRISIHVRTDSAPMGCWQRVSQSWGRSADKTRSSGSLLAMNTARSWSPRPSRAAMARCATLSRRASSFKVPVCGPPGGGVRSPCSPPVIRSARDIQPDGQLRRQPAIGRMRSAAASPLETTHGGIVRVASPPHARPGRGLHQSTYQTPSPVVFARRCERLTWYSTAHRHIALSDGVLCDTQPSRTQFHDTR